MQKIFIVQKKLKGILGAKVGEVYKNIHYCKSLKGAKIQLNNSREYDIYYDSKFRIIEKYLED